MKRLEKGGSSVRKALRDWWQALEHLILPPVPCGLWGEQPCLPVEPAGDVLILLPSAGKERSRRPPVFFPFPIKVRQGFDTPYEISADIRSPLPWASSWLGGQEEPALAQVDILVPVPLSPGRLEKRDLTAALLADNIGVWKRQVCAAAVRTRRPNPKAAFP